MWKRANGHAQRISSCPGSHFTKAWKRRCCCSRSVFLMNAYFAFQLIWRHYSWWAPSEGCAGMRAGFWVRWWRRAQHRAQLLRRPRSRVKKTRLKVSTPSNLPFSIWIGSIYFVGCVCFHRGGWGGVGVGGTSGEFLPTSVLILCKHALFKPNLMWRLSKTVINFYFSSFLQKSRRPWKKGWKRVPAGEKERVIVFISDI